MQQEGRKALFCSSPQSKKHNSSVCMFILWVLVVKWKLWYAAWFHCSQQYGMTLKTLEWKTTWIKSLVFQSRGYTQEGEGIVGRGELGLCLPKRNSMFIIEETHTLLKLTWLEENYFLPATEIPKHMLVCLMGTDFESIYGMYRGILSENIYKEGIPAAVIPFILTDISNLRFSKAQITHDLLSHAVPKESGWTLQLVWELWTNITIPWKT